MQNQIIVSLSDYSSASRYKAEVRVVSPEIARSTLGQGESCFVGISLESSNFLGGKLQSIVDYISNRYSNCTFLLGDHVHRLTLQIRKDLSQEQCFYHALGMGDYYLRTQQHMLRHSQTGEAFPVLRGSDIYQAPEVVGYMALLEQQFRLDSNFKMAIEGFAGQFINRSNETPQGTADSSEAVRLSCQYVLEELAETCYMISKGHPVLIYPGSLAIFQQISNGLFKGLPKEMERLINVGLRLKRRGKKLVQPEQQQAVLSQL